MPRLNIVTVEGRRFELWNSTSANKGPTSMDDAADDVAVDVAKVIDFKTTSEAIEALSKEEEELFN